MRPLTSQFSASVARRDQVVKKTWVGAVPRTAAATASGVLEVGGERRDALDRARGRAAQAGDLPAVGEQARARLPPLMPVTPTTSARPAPAVAASRDRRRLVRSRAVA